MTTFVTFESMSDAMKAVDQHRDAMHPGAVKLFNQDATAVAYLYQNRNGQPVACCYKGRSKKPSECYRYRSEEQRQNSVNEFFSKIQKYKREQKPRALKVGDVLKASWGYDQTNIDYFLVKGLVGKQSVELVEIGAKSVESQTISMTGTCIPDKSKEISEPFTRRVNPEGDGVTVDRCRYATLKKPEIVGGVEVYSADSWTSYA